MRTGSLKNQLDREAIKRDVVAIATVVMAGLAVLGLQQALDIHWAMAWVAVVVAGGLAGVAMVRWPSLADPPDNGQAAPGTHPGIRAHSIPVAGAPGFLFVIFVAVSFWFEVPNYRSLVLAATALGGLLGIALIWFRRQ
jgi:hypothetical protein